MSSRGQRGACDRWAEWDPASGKIVSSGLGCDAPDSGLSHALPEGLATASLLGLLGLKPPPPVAAGMLQAGMRVIRRQGSTPPAWAVLDVCLASEAASHGSCANARAVAIEAGVFPNDSNGPAWVPEVRDGTVIEIVLAGPQEDALPVRCRYATEGTSASASACVRAMRRRISVEIGGELCPIDRVMESSSTM